MASYYQSLSHNSPPPHSLPHHRPAHSRIKARHRSADGFHAPSPSPSRALSLPTAGAQPPYLVPLARPRTRLALARANSHPIHPPTPPVSVRRPPNRTRTSAASQRLPTSPTPASAVTAASGFTAAGRMVESTHCPRETISRALRAVSQTGFRTDRPRTESSRCPSFMSATDDERAEPDSRAPSVCSSAPPSPCGPEACRICTAPAPRSSGCPGSTASTYISFASLNVLAPPSPPESVVGTRTEEEEEAVEVIETEGQSGWWSRVR